VVFSDIVDFFESIDFLSGSSSLASLFFFLDLGLLIPNTTPSEVAEIVDSSSLSVFFLVARSLLGLVEESIVMLAKEVSRTVVPLGSKIENWQPEKPKIVGDWVF
jgi:hypothetical protein